MSKLKTILIGFGNIAEQMAHDRVKAKTTPYASHVQVLRDHPDFDWVAVIDPSPEKRQAARSRWHIDIAVPDLESLPENIRPDIAVIATASSYRIPVIQHLPTLKGVLVEKPLGTNIQTARNFAELCAKRQIAGQVNFWRRGDATSRNLMNGQLETLIGPLQTAFGIYGNGLRNNAVHMIDYTRMLLGDIVSVQALSAPQTNSTLPIAGDVLIPFSLTLDKGEKITFHALDFKYFRENGLTIWGEKGQLSILQEGWRFSVHQTRPHATLGDATEIDFDNNEKLKCGTGHAFFNMYDNLSKAVQKKDVLWSPVKSALHNEEIIEAILRSAQDGLKPIEISA